MDRSITPPPPMPGAWVDSPPSFNPERPAPPNRSALMPSEPKKPELDPRIAERVEFYYDLAKGFSDWVLSVYRQEYLPKLKPEEGRPGMFLLKKGPSKEFLDAKFSDAVENRDRLGEEASKNGLYKFDKHDLERPTAVLNVDFCVSASSDYVQPPPPRERMMAKPVPFLHRSRQSARDLKTLRIGQPRPPSPPPREPSHELVAFKRPSQEDIHAGHECFDVERLAREFMWWFIEWRASIRRHIDPNNERSLEAMVHNYTRRGPFGWVERTMEDQYKHVLNNLIWELQHPRASRPGQTNPNGTHLQGPWIPGGELIHAILGLSKAHESTVQFHLTTMMRFAHTMRLEKNYSTPLAFPPLWDVLERSAAPFDEGKARDDDMIHLANGKRTHQADMEPYVKERKRRLRWDGTPEVHEQEPDVKEDNDDENNGGLSDAKREKLISELNKLKDENQKLQTSFKTAQKEAIKANDKVCKLNLEKRELESELEAGRRTQGWVEDVNKSEPGPPSDDVDHDDPMDIDG